MIPNSLTRLTIPDTVTYEDVTYTVVSIGYNVFGSSDFTKVTLPDTITYIDGYAFFRCNKLKEINLPDSITEIGENAFSECTALDAITLPSSLKIIGYGAFDGCFNLACDIIFPEGLQKIESRAFYATRLGNIILPFDHFAYSVASSLILSQGFIPAPVESMY